MRAVDLVSIGAILYKGLNHHCEATIIVSGSESEIARGISDVAPLLPLPRARANGIPIRETIAGTMTDAEILATNIGPLAARSHPRETTLHHDDRDTTNDIAGVVM